jgi:hypothetical protein
LFLSEERCDPNLVGVLTSVLDEHGYSIPWLIVQDSEASVWYISERFSSWRRLERIFVQVIDGEVVSVEINGYEYGEGKWAPLTTHGWRYEALMIKSSIQRRLVSGYQPPITKRLSGEELRLFAAADAAGPVLVLRLTNAFEAPLEFAVCGGWGQNPEHTLPPFGGVTHLVPEADTFLLSSTWKWWTTGTLDPHSSTNVCSIGLSSVDAMDPLVIMRYRSIPTDGAF